MADMLSPGVEFYIKDSSYYTSTNSSTVIGVVGGATKGPLTPTLIGTRAEAIKIFGTPTTNDFGVYSLLGALTRSNQVYYRRVVKESSLATAGDPGIDRLLFESRYEDSMFNNVGIRVEVDPEKTPDPVGTVQLDTLTETDLNTAFYGRKVRDLVGENYEVKLVGDHFWVTGVINQRDDLSGTPESMKGTNYWAVIALKDDSDPTVTTYSLTGEDRSFTLGTTGDGEHRTVLLIELDPEQPERTIKVGDQDYRVIYKYATLRGQAAPPKFNDDEDKFFKVTVKYNDVEEVFDNCTLATVEDKIDDISNYIYVDVNEDETTRLRNAYYHLSGGGQGASFATTPEDADINFASNSYDSTLNGATIRIGEKDFFGLFNIYLFDPLGNQLEQLSSLSLNPEDPRFIETFVNSNSEYITCSYNEEGGKDITETEYKLTGGSDGMDGLGDAEIVDGLDDFSNIDLVDVDILCAPGWTDREVIDAGIKVCEQRQDCLYLIDPPFGLHVQQVIDWTNAAGDFSDGETAPLNSSYGAVYWPWVQIYDNDNKTYVWLPPSGYVAAQMAYSDQVSRQWFAPAGLTRGVMTGINAIEYSPTKEERDQLYGNRNVVNAIMSYRGQGLVIWGQKTTQRNPTALDRVNVRRLVNYIKRTITGLSGQFVFEVNDARTWEQWLMTVDPILRTIQADRGLYAYEIIMDSTTVTQQDIENNRMPGIIRIRPTKTAEFIPITFEIVSGQFVFTNGSGNTDTTTDLAGQR